MSTNLLTKTIYWPDLFFISPVLKESNLCDWHSHLFSLYKMHHMSGNNKSQIIGRSINNQLKWYVVTSVLYYSRFSLEDWASLCDVTIGHHCCLCQKTKTFLRMHERTRRSTCTPLCIPAVTSNGTVAPSRLVILFKYLNWLYTQDCSSGGRSVEPQSGRIRTEK